MNAAQTIVNGVWIRVREPESIGIIFRHWRRTLPVGAMSMGGSAAWAIAMSMETATKVRSLGQLELLLTFVVSRVWLRQRIAVVSLLRVDSCLSEFSASPCWGDAASSTRLLKCRRRTVPQIVWRSQRRRQSLPVLPNRSAPSLLCRQ